MLVPSMARAAAPQVIDTGEMALEFQAGWLAKWTNKKTGETVTFGTSTTGEKAWAYQPGVWWYEADRPKPEARGSAKWDLKLVAEGADTAVLTESAQVPGGLAEAVQWSMQIPLDQIEMVHIPWGLAPARVITKDYHTANFEAQSGYFEKRSGILSFHEWRQRFYILQGKTGGLLIYCDDPNFESRQALEYDVMQKGWMTLTNRSMACAPFKDSYQSSRWVIRQFQGWLNNGAQMYQDYLAKTYKITPLEKRGTSWVSKLAFCINKPEGLQPPNYTGPGGVGLNYNSDWPKNLKAAGEWLDELAKVFEPDKTMFYTTGWRAAGMDANFPSNDIDPFFLYTCQMARKRGFHVMLHMHNHLVQDETTLYMRYFRDQSRLMGIKLAEKPSEDVPYGLGFDALRNSPMAQRNKHFGSSYYDKMGLDQTMTGYHIHPGWEAYRYMRVANIVAAVQATGADMIHLDVPSIWHDRYDDRYPQNMAQGMREMYKLLRETLDEHGLANVAIATEVAPSEPILPYVDVAQMALARSALNLVQGKFSDTLLELQVGKEYDAAVAQRAGLAAGATGGRTKDKNSAPQLPFVPELFDKVVGAMVELGQPSVLAMVNGPFVLGYPHVGAISPTAGGPKEDLNYAVSVTAAQALQVWWSFTNNTIPNTQGTVFIDEKVNEGRVGLGRFWQAQGPRLAPPSEWQRGDIARYRLADGSAMWVTRPANGALRFHLTGDKVLADLDIFQGWKNDELLRKYEVPEVLAAAEKVEGVKIMETNLPTTGPLPTPAPEASATPKAGP